MSHLIPRSGATETRQSCYSPFAVADAKLWVLDEHTVDEHSKKQMP